MKNKSISIGLFALTFITGSFLIFSPEENSISNETKTPIVSSIPIEPETTKAETKQANIISYETAKRFGGAEMLEENFYEREIKYKFELLQTGVFHGDEVTAKSGEKWLGLFGNKNDFHLAATKINVSRVHDEIVDGDDEKTKTGKKVSVSNQIKPLFLLKNASKLKEGKVKTIFKGLTSDEISETEEYSTDLKTEFVYDYKMGGENYSLRVERIFNKNVEIVYALILESGATKQILHVSSEDYLGTLYWVGDLDDDDKPDFYLAPWIKENVSEVSLFLSSEADKKNLVKKVAMLGTVGC